MGRHTHKETEKEREREREGRENGLEVKFKSGLLEREQGRGGGTTSCTGQPRLARVEMD